MDNEQARFLLGACQPGGADTSQPEIAAALEQARRDPELGAWLARERRSDAAIIAKMRQLEPSAELRARLLAGGMASRRRRGWRAAIVRLGIAATIAVAAGAVWTCRIHSASTVAVAGTPLHQWQASCVSLFANPLFSLDLSAKTYEPLEAHLRSVGAQVAGELPFSHAIVSAVGCKIIDWHGGVVSLTCFRSDSGELVHLFVARRRDVDEAALEDGVLRAQVGAYATVTWRNRDLIVMVASRLPAAELERALLPARRVAAIAHARRTIASL